MRVIIVFAALVLVIIGYSSAFTVSETEKAILFKWGKIERSDYEPGLHFKIPFVNDVRWLDARIQTFSANPEDYLTEEKKIVVVDSFIQWKIDDVRNFYTSMRGDMNIAEERIATIVKEGLRNEFGVRELQDLISGERTRIMDEINIHANHEVKNFGIKIIDVRIKRIEFPPKVNDKIFRRMESERTRIAKELRAEGNESAARIKADADKQVTVIAAEAFRDAEKLRGEGDAKAAEIYANAYGQDEEFYAFLRRLNAYRSSFDAKGDVLVLEPDSDFFRYFNNITGQ